MPDIGSHHFSDRVMAYSSNIRAWAAAILVTFIATASVTAAAEDKPASPVSETKDAVKHGAHAVGHTTHTVTRAVGHGTRHAARAIGHATRDAAHGVGSAAKDAWRGLTGNNGK
jgi:hypothetical protein